jgi:hypothetical protein
VVEAPVVEPPVVVEPPDALDDELVDEHAAVRASSMTAAAPAVGTAINRFILAPSRESWVRLPVPDGNERAPFERAVPGLLASL